METDWTWSGKILFLADISTSVLNADAFKTMASGQNACTITEKGKAVDLEINGKPVMFLTSAFPNPSVELLSRFPILSLTESNTQTESILNFHAKKALDNTTEIKYNQTLRLALDFLEEIVVIVPYAEGIVEKFPKELMARRAFPRFLDYVKASVALHQYSREKRLGEDGIYHYVAQKEDYELGKVCFEATSSNAQLMPLTQQQKKILKWFADNKQESFCFSDLQEKPLFAGVAERTLRRQLEKLTGYGLLSVSNIRLEHSIRPVQQYKFKSYSALELPEWEAVQKAWQNRQNGNTNNNMADKAEQAEQEKNKESFQSAKSSRSANDIPLCTFSSPSNIENEPESDFESRKADEARKVKEKLDEAMSW